MAPCGTRCSNLVQFADEPAAMQWEFKLEKRPIFSPTFKLSVPVLNDTVELTTKLRAFRAGENDEYLSFLVDLPTGTRARLVQWVGPRAIKSSYWTDEWTGCQTRGGRDRGQTPLNHWRIADHIEDGILRVGIAVLLTEPSKFPKVCPRFCLLEQVDKGAFGAVRKVEDKDDEENILVAKIDRTQDNKEDVWWETLSEANILFQLSKSTGFPKFEGLFSSGDANMIVMQRLHRNLESLMRDTHVGTAGRNGRHLSASTVVGVGYRCIDRLETMHELGLLHRDIKPENIMIDKYANNEIYLVDFGLSRPFRVAGVSFQPSGACGTVRYFAVRTHDGCHAPITDLETLCHVLCYVAVGKLPWSGIENSQRKYRDNKIRDAKKNHKLLGESLRETCPQVLADALLEMVDYCRECKLDERPDYDWLRNTLADAGTSLEQPLGRIATDQSTCTNYDWIACTGGLTTTSAMSFKVDDDDSFDFSGKGTDVASKGSRGSRVFRTTSCQWDSAEMVIEEGTSIWTVVGGSDTTGGILVREGESTKSGVMSEEGSRLSTGAVVKALQLKGDRLNYSLISGTGPAQGWVSLRVGAKELLEPFGAFDGAWEDEGAEVAYISCAVLHWSENGKTNSMDVTSATTFSITVVEEKSETYLAELRDDGKLYWSDDQIWRKIVLE